MRPFLRRLTVNDSFFSVWQRSDPSIGYAWHYHTEYELAFVTQSEGKRFVGDSIESYAGGDLILLAPNLPHTYASDKESKLPRHEHVVVHFSHEILGGAATSNPDLGPASRLLQDSARGILFATPAADRVRDALCALPKKPGLTRLASFLEVLDILSLVPAAQKRILSGQSFSPEAAGGDHRSIAKICKFLEGNFTRAIPLSEAAHQAAMSESAFARFFHHATGRTFTNYLNELRLRHASRMLLDTNRGIAEIAAASGFVNVSYFNRRFARARGMSPGEFRRSLRKIDPALMPET